MDEELAKKLSLVDKFYDFVGKVGVPGAICGALLYIIHTFFRSLWEGQVTIIKNQEHILSILQQILQRGK